MWMKRAEDLSRNLSFSIQMQSDEDEHRTSTTTARRMRTTTTKKKKRTPLADLTNACIPLKQLKPAVPPSSIPGDAPVPGPDPGVPALPPDPSASFLDPGGNAVKNDKPVFSTVYTRRQHCEERIICKEKEPCTTSSCPPVQRTRSVEKGKQVDDTDPERQKAFSVPLRRPKKKQRCVSSEPIKSLLPRDFVEKQKAYFAEVDAFELLEEVASENELE